MLLPRETELGSEQTQEPMSYSLEEVGTGGVENGRCEPKAKPETSNLTVYFSIWAS